ncbi:MAG: hypothetical protein WBJ19_06645, partial [Rhodoferax sp.]
MTIEWKNSYKIGNAAVGMMPFVKTGNRTAAGRGRGLCVFTCPPLEKIPKFRSTALQDPFPT